MILNGNIEPLMVECMLMQRLQHLVEQIRQALPDLEIGPVDELGVPADAKEALAFAVLANETLVGNSGNLPAVTGAQHGAVLGKICLGREQGIDF